MQLDLKASASEEENLTDYYIILRTLGKGTFAEVKLAYHLHTKVHVAVKILENGNKNDDNNSEVDIVKLLDHPNIIKLFHIISTKAYTYMVMEHAARGDLVSHIQKVGCLQEQQAQRIFTQIVCAVHYCHEKGIAHRDIKLDNILLDSKGNIKLCDFGLATRVTSGQMSKGFCGTLEYCAPELFTDTEYDAKAVDIWSVGVVLYTMLTGCFPFNAKTYSAMKEKVLNPKYYIPYTFSQNTVNLIDQLFTVMPEQRPKISDIRQHPWFKGRGKILKFQTISETLGNDLNPSIVVAMWGMGYHPKDITDCIREKNFNNIMATYRILNHKSAQDHSIYADALTALSPHRGVGEPALSTITLPSEHQTDDEVKSRNKRSRSLSMPATLCWHQKGDNPPYLVPKCAPKVTNLLSTKQVPKCAPKGTYILSTNQDPKCAPKGTYLLSTNQDPKCAPKGTYILSTNQDPKCAPQGTYLLSTNQDPKCAPQGTYLLSTNQDPKCAPKGTYLLSTNQDPRCAPEITDLLSTEVHNSSPEVTHVMSRSLAIGSTDSKGRSSRCSFTEHISSTHYLSLLAPQEVNTPKICSHTQSKPSVRKYRELSQGVTTTATHGLQRSSLQAASKTNSECVLPEDVAATSASNLPRGWQRVKKRIENWMRLLCCCCQIS